MRFWCGLDWLEGPHAQHYIQGPWSCSQTSGLKPYTACCYVLWSPLTSCWRLTENLVYISHNPVGGALVIPEMYTCYVFLVTPILVSASEDATQVLVSQHQQQSCVHWLALWLMLHGNLHLSVMHNCFKSKTLKSLPSRVTLSKAEERWQLLRYSECHCETRFLTAKSSFGCHTKDYYHNHWHTTTMFHFPYFHCLFGRSAHLWAVCSPSQWIASNWLPAGHSCALGYTATR